MYKKAIAEIQAYIYHARTMLPNVTDDMLHESGKICYMNGNDSTRFDWNENNRLCEFCISYKDSANYFIVVFVNKDDTIEGYVFKDEFNEKLADMEIKKLEIGCAESLMDFFDENADKKGLFNKTLDEIIA